MERIYFDKQIFSYLFKGTDPVYQKFLNDLYSNKKNFLYCYSHGHLLDLKNDPSDIKYKELEFIETLVGDNYLSYHAANKTTSAYLAKPLEAFKDVEIEEEPFSLTNLFDNIDLSLTTPEENEKIALAKDALLNHKLDFGFLQSEVIAGEQNKILSKVLPFGNSSMTLVEWSEHLMDFLKLMQEDKSVYKELRIIADKYINNKKYPIDINDIDFNDDLKNSVLQKTFIEYVNGNLNPNGGKEITNYDFFINAYFTLDLLGISKEPSKSVKFRSLLNDGYHSYYGAFCDYVVSGDNGFLKKTKAMYKLLNIKTKVYHIEEFIEYFYLLSRTENDSKTFFDLLINDIQNGLVINSRQAITNDRFTTTIKPFHNYFGYFNMLENITENNRNYIFLSRKTENYSYFSFYREYQGVINKAVKLFGIDNNLKGEFEWEKEIDEINKKTWKGRTWNLGHITLIIEINSGTEKLSLLILFPETQK
ncbi:MAG: hypothetical protein J0I09_10515 [Sphingobacteriia bacterium]|nr:hypothetical protein [Sphingobacteriia bacterium]